MIVYIAVSAVRIRDDVQAGRRPASRLLPVDLPDYVKELIAQCWAQDPADRPVFSGTPSFVHSFILILIKKQTKRCFTMEQKV